MKSFYLQVANTLADLLGVCILSLTHILLLNDDSTIPFPFYQKKILLAGVSAAKKCWLESGNFLILSHTSFLNVLGLELSIARTNRAEKQPIGAFRRAREKVHLTEPAH